MYIERVPNRNSPPAVLLRKSWREDGKTKKKTLANLSHLPEHLIEIMKRALKGEVLVSANDLFNIKKTTPHGHVHAILTAIKKCGLDKIISSKKCRERDLVVAMIADRLLHGASKLGTTRMWDTTTLGEELNVGDADENELYAALDWLLAQKKRIEKKLVNRHISSGDRIFYDISSSYYEGQTCPLATYGYNRDKKKGKKIIVYGVMTDEEGRPLTIDVYEGNTADASTVTDQVEKLRGEFGLSDVVLVSDRGIITQTKVDHIKKYPGLSWISALRGQSIQQLFDQGDLGPSLFDEKNLAEIKSDLFPNERLVACFNPLLADERKRKREALLEETEKNLQKIKRMVARRTQKIMDRAEIAEKVGRIIDKHKMAKHFTVTIEDNSLKWERHLENIRKEEELDGIYVIRTSEPSEKLTAENVVRQYKNLSKVETAFRTMKGADIKVRPIRHRTEDHVKAHIFLCMLTYYVQWHMKEALSPLLFEDEDLEFLRNKRDPVAPAQPSQSAIKKKAKCVTEDGFEVHSFGTLLSHLGTQCRNICEVKSDTTQASFTQLTEPSKLQIRAFELLNQINCTQ